jgi:GNAT superfamily N-acetyltransferase
MASIALDRRETRLAVGTTTDRRLLREFLERDRLLAAYAICDLDDREFVRTRWGVARDPGGAVASIVLEYSGASPQPLFVMGEDEGITAILRDVIKPRIAFIAASAANLGAVERQYRLDPGPEMVRMSVDREAFLPVQDPGVERLRASDVSDLNRLYRLGFGSWLATSAITEGVYYGIRVRGRLVAAAGTHVVGREARIAVVGNVLTQPEYRGRGYAEATTAAVTTELLGFCDHVVLNVRADNPPALSAYRRLGYLEHARFEERLAHRTGSILADLAGALRRRIAPKKESPNP